jgi:hypothetical protein
MRGGPPPHNCTPVRTPERPEHALSHDPRRSLTSWPAYAGIVGDLKYKRLQPAGYLNADLYQVAAYAGAAGLSEALLIYAAGEGDALIHRIVNAGPRLRVVSVDLSLAPGAILAQVGEIAQCIRGLAAAA